MRHQLGHPVGPGVDACRFKLRAVLERLTSCDSAEDANRFARASSSTGHETARELAIFCRQNMARHRREWTPFLIRQVSEALERIDDGSYGLCVQCGQTIEARRLAALPWVAYCTTCQDENSGFVS
jgi:RNA polymerase-binding transcription factor DksA